MLGRQWLQLELKLGLGSVAEPGLFREPPSQLSRPLDELEKVHSDAYTHLSHLHAFPTTLMAAYEGPVKDGSKPSHTLAKVPMPRSITRGPEA